MWPSNDEVKNTLCETGVILFRESHLQLNPRIDLAKTFLDRELLISAIDASNALFDQKEKLKLAVLLRDYIYSSSYLDTLHLNIQNFWKDCYEFLKSFLVEFPIISIFLILTFVPVFLPIRWLKIKLDIRSTERKQIKQRENLSLGIEEAKNQSNLINPLTIIHGPELFKIPEKKQSLVPNLTEERLIENLADIFNLLSKKSERPLNADSSNEVTESAGRSIEKLVENVNAINKQFEAPIITLEKVIENLVALYQLFEEPNLTLDKMTQNLFAINESSESANPSIDKMIPNLIAINDLFSKHLNRRIGVDSTYTLKNNLKEGLQLIYYRLKGNFDPLLGPVMEKSALIYKLYEGLTTCTPGFHNRVNTIIESFNTIENFSELLYLIRKSLIEKTASKQIQYYHSSLDPLSEVHTYNDFTRIAHQEGLGVPLGTDIFHGDINWRYIRKTLQTEFENNYTLFNLPTLLTESLRGLLINVGYTGAKPIDSSYTVGTEESEVEKITQLIKKLLSTDFQNIGWQDFFIIDDETYNILDVNWKFIKSLFFKQLTSENYFKVCSDEDFNEHLSNLLDYIQTTHDNYFTLLARIEPKSFKTLFYRLEKTLSKKLQEKVIGLFFEKDETGLTPLQIIAQNNPEILTCLLGFIDSAPCHQANIQTLFIKQRDLFTDSFVSASRRQSQSAFILLDYFLKHPEIFNPYTLDSGLFLNHLIEIRHGLSYLMTKREPDITRGTTVLRFLSSFPSVFFQPPKEVIDFLFNTLSQLDDKPLITTIVSQYSALLLKNFSISYFKDQNKNLAFITEKLLDAYADELIERSNNHVKYITQFFNYSFGYSTSEKLTALTVIKDILNNDSNSEKIEQLRKAKSAHPTLRNGRLSHLFKACTQDIAITSQIKFQRQI